MRKFKRFLVFVLCLIVFCSTIIFASISISKSQNDGENGLLSKKSLGLLTSVIKNVKRYYYKTVGEGELLKKALDGMLNSLDPHSSYLSKEDLKDLEMETSGQFGGIGVEVLPDKGAILVVTPLDDTPAYKAGIKSGDYIVQINDQLVRDMTLKEAVGMMRGKKGTKLKLTVNVLSLKRFTLFSSIL